ncbi:lysozyme, partial [Campylobacter fetus subsp. testudinum]
KLKKLRIELLKKLSWISSLELSLQEALLEMAYQLGVPKMLGFKNTLECIRLGDFTQAIINLKASLWYKQTPKRVENLIKALV